MNDAPRSVFVISPIGEDGSDTRQRSDKVLRHIIRKALPGPEFRVLRADEDESADSITPGTIRRIWEAHLCVADLSDQNPNVFYELAVAHGYHRPVVHICQEGDKIPFDLQDQRTIFYDITDPDSIEESVAKLVAQSKAVLEEGFVQHNPLTGAERYFSLTRDGRGSATEGEAVLADALEDLGSRMRALQASIATRFDTVDAKLVRVFEGAGAQVPSEELVAILGAIERVGGSVSELRSERAQRPPATLPRIGSTKRSSSPRSPGSRSSENARVESRQGEGRLVVTSDSNSQAGSGPKRSKVAMDGPMNEFLGRSRARIMEMGVGVRIEAEDPSRAVLMSKNEAALRRIQNELKDSADALGISLETRRM